VCLIALAIGQSQAWPLVLASNRDEFFARPTLPLEPWRTFSGQRIVSGRDLQAGGTWLGLTDGGRVAMLTNVREPGSQVGARSRGELPLAWLQSRRAAPDFFSDLDGSAYSGFNLLVGDTATGTWHWASNREASAHGLRPGWQQRSLPPGFYSLSNAFLDTPWPKALRLKSALQRALLGGADPAQALWAALADRSPAAPSEMPRTGIALETERLLSSAMVCFPDGRYGTRASTLLMATPSAQGLSVRVQEKTWRPDGTHSLSAQELSWPRVRA
jgi:uncharacterized protein with NRDE domain